MLNPSKTTTSLIALGILLVNLSSCQKQDASSEGKGPAEKAGQKLDQAAAKASEEMNKAAEKAGKGLQELGQKLESDAQQAQNPKKE